MARTSPTQRTLRFLRQEGSLVDVAERWMINPRVPGGGFRKDLFGFVDLVVLDPDQGIGGIQSCGQSFAEHKRKLLDSECTQFVVEWLKCGGYVELWGWRKVKLKKGGKAMRWKPRLAKITLFEEGLKFEEIK
ncbi:MAG: hypothetical protein GY774_35550 [Planctomycetes bacterium]|nr:hypothetical protein [Planctomycetota bacterium]